jgi:hypothetical protein
LPSLVLQMGYPLSTMAKATIESMFSCSVSQLGGYTIDLCLDPSHSGV